MNLGMRGVSISIRVYVVIAEFDSGRREETEQQVVERRGKKEKKKRRKSNTFCLYLKKSMLCLLIDVLKA